MWIRLLNIQLFGYHGVHEYERTNGARFEIDVEIRADLTTASSTDALSDTIDYATLAKKVEASFLSPASNLLETVATRIGDMIFAQYPTVEELIVRIRKPGAAVGVVLKTVEVEVQRSRGL